MSTPLTDDVAIRERRLAREEAFRLLFQMDQGMVPPAEVLRFEAQETELAPAAWDLAHELAAGAWDQRARIDPLLDQLASGWSVARMASADRAILRLGAFEVLCRPDTPVGVSINDAVELAKRYGTDDSPRFINGILGSIAREHRGEAPAQEPKPRGRRRKDHAS
jgi:N utilization substance protein B